MNKQKIHGFIDASDYSNIILDSRDGLHCSSCGEKGEDVPVLLNNPKLPRVICWKCFTFGIQNFITETSIIAQKEIEEA